MIKKTGLGVTVDRFEESVVVIHTDDGQELKLNKSVLPADVKEGARLNISFSGDLAEEAAREQLARNLLKEIIKGK
ncbi:MAG: DUF3006 domain-containing protein [Patescibacteria group bacterium]